VDRRRSEAERNAATYRGYARDARKQRAWSSVKAGNQAIREELVAALLPHLPAQGVIADVGCGKGWLLATLAERGIEPARLRGIDLLPDRVDAARARVPDAQVQEGDACHLPYADGSIAAVVLLTVLSSLSSTAAQRAALHETRRVLRRGGAAIIWEPRVLTPNRATRHLRRSLVGSVFGPGAVTVQSLTVLPPLARRLPGPRAYRLVAAVPILRTHRLLVVTCA